MALTGVGFQESVQVQARPGGHQAPLAHRKHRLTRLVGGLAAQPAGWSHLVRFDAGQRWYHRLELASDYEIWLLSWLPGQHTGFHDHGEAAGAFAVARGRLSERTVAPGRSQARSRSLAAGSLRAFGPRHVHDVANAAEVPAVSVHAYSPPLTAMRRYELTSGGLVQVARTQAGRDW
jgi:predicted metal-dependent enzyme (double-stranded beta helix superfamily)